MAETERLDAVVIGAGFGGLYALHRLRGMGLSVRVLEEADGVGGTWRWNKYPGCRCDVESIEYSYSFSPELEQEWTWTERYPSQEEVLRYLEHVTDRFDLRRDIQFETRVASATFDADEERWLVETDRGERISAQFCVTAVGCLSRRNLPAFEGLEDFEGRVVHTGEWPEEEVDFSGQRVGVIGTGSSGVQVIPEIARQAEHLYVFQRTPHYVVPARNRPLPEERMDEVKAGYPERREMLRESFFGFSIDLSEQPALEASPEQREAEYRARWEQGGPAIMGTFADLIVDEAANETAAEFFRERIAETVDDPEVAALLTPHGYPFGTKRLCQGTDYYETYNRDNVTLVDVLGSPIERITASGIETADGSYELDAIVLATGYDAVTGALLGIDITGRDGLKLADKWAAGPQTYLGIATRDFPNLLMITGPGSPSVLSNVIVSIEQHVDWIADLIAYMRERDLQTIEPTAEAEAEWGEHVQEVAHATLFPRAGSWYMGANVEGKPRVFMPYLGGVGVYRERCEEVVANGYEGFALEPAAAAPA